MLSGTSAVTPCLHEPHGSLFPSRRPAARRLLLRVAAGGSGVAACACSPTMSFVLLAPR